MIVDTVRSKGTGVLLASVLFAAALSAVFREPATMGAEEIQIGAGLSRIPEGALIQLSPEGPFDLMSADGRSAKSVAGKIIASPDRKYASRTLAIPLAMQWKHPKEGLPAAQVVRINNGKRSDARGPARTFIFHDHGDLPVIAIVMDHDDLFDADRGIMVPGNAMLNSNVPLSASYERDPKWWKYPGNFMGRGKEWERPAQVEFIDPDGSLKNTAIAGVRIHGQMTRGFPQHALRLTFKEQVSPWNMGGTAHRSMVLRAAGNDQVKAMMRDVVAHRLCEGAGFDVSAATTCVVYINGVYWGVHHLRDRLDEHELQARYSMDRKEIVILEDDGELYHGKENERIAFHRSVRALEKARSLEEIGPLLQQIDVEGFFNYMASQMILGNMDRPEQNVRYWRYVGPKADGFRDGKWRFMMGDSDLALGANASAIADPYLRVQRSNAIIPRLFRSIIAHQYYRDLFIAAFDRTLKGPLNEERSLAIVDAVAGSMKNEMDLHTARWRKPRDRRSWETEVEVIRKYLIDRHANLRNKVIAPL